MKHYLLLLLTSLTLISNVLGQDIFVDIQCTNPYPGVGEQIKLSYILKIKVQGGSVSISHNGIKIKKPTLKNCNIIQEGNESNGFMFGNIGGDMQLSKYSFVLQPTSKGKITIDPFTFQMNGKEYESKSFTLNVGEGDPNVKIIPQNSKLFARIESSKSEIYEGEHMLVTYKLYSQYGNISLQKYDFPMQKGLWTEEIPAGKQGWPQSQENIDGKNYLVVPLKKEIVFGRTKGSYSLPSITLDLLIGGNIFSPGSKESIKSNSPKITVKPLPSNAPPSFDNQTGKNYKLEVTYATTQLKTNEPLDLKIKISGEGNLKQLEPLTLNLPKDFEQYDAEVIDNTKLNASGISGSKTFNYLVIPRYHGKFDLPKIEFSYFDLNSKKYITLSHPAQTIIVEKADGGKNGGTILSSQSEVEILNNDIRHIHYKTHLNNSEQKFFGSPIYFSLLAIPFTASLMFLFLFKKINPKNNTPSNNGKLITKKALKIVASAQEKLNSNDDKGFYEALYKGLQEYLSHKLNIPLSQLNTNTIEAALIQNEIATTTTQKLIEIIENCTMARFSPTTIEGAKDTLNNCIELIKTIEKNVKK